MDERPHRRPGAWVRLDALETTPAGAETLAQRDLLMQVATHPAAPSASAFLRSMLTLGMHWGIHRFAPGEPPADTMGLHRIPVARVDGHRALERHRERRFGHGLVGLEEVHHRPMGPHQGAVARIAASTASRRVASFVISPAASAITRRSCIGNTATM